ncbi:MotA/TolQ/ExbB proton channel family protein [uncultured Massilia sp.]|uniref:MotA/TolQ/ExbB proton channel family protein n=1 Tax=uncultured Massilia sp. TaxID=169973 RepID=UPI0025F952CA|nr:MotA/TolQ/ExbB proton channel family protein [uncultured Massilia sp.]
MSRSFRSLVPCILCLPALPVRAQDLTIASQLANGGTGIVVTGLLSVLALAVVFERLANLRAARLAPQDLADDARGLWQAGRFAELRERVADGRSVLARILGELAGRPGLPQPVLAARAAEMASLELRLQQQKAYALNVVATIAPIVGLLGTVIGMIESFHVIAASGMGDPTQLAGGISKALVNTAAGLSVALPALAAHHIFRHRLVGIGILLERQLNAVLDAAPAATASLRADPAATEAVHAH